ncbi:MAG: hypothetical protein WBB22_07570 [Anaerolineae bacterium]
MKINEKNSHEQNRRIMQTVKGLISTVSSYTGKGADVGEMY